MVCSDGFALDGVPVRLPCFPPLLVFRLTISSGYCKNGCGACASGRAGRQSGPKNRHGGRSGAETLDSEDGPGPDGTLGVRATPQQHDFSTTYFCLLVYTYDTNDFPKKDATVP
jgi:hypothetical protein